MADHTYSFYWLDQKQKGTMNPSNDDDNCNKPWKNQKSKISYYCINCLYSFRTIKKLQSHEKVCKNNDYCYLKMPDESDKILKFNQDEKSIIVSSVIDTDSVSLLKNRKNYHRSKQVYIMW